MLYAASVQTEQVLLKRRTAYKLLLARRLAAHKRYLGLYGLVGLIS
jgi:hypothetical protein